MHLDDLLGDGKAQPRAALGSRTRSVDLVKLLEDPIPLLWRNAGSRITDAEGKVTVGCSCRDAYLADVGELDGIPDQIEQHLC
jgi:hypothetical protein